MLPPGLPAPAQARPDSETAGAWLAPGRDMEHGGPLPLLARAMRLRTAISALNVECTFTL